MLEWEFYIKEIDFFCFLYCYILFMRLDFVKEESFYQSTILQ